MAKLSSVTGLKTVIQNLHAAKDKIGLGVGRGLRKGGLFLLQATDKYTPVQLGTLRNSKFIRNVGGAGYDTDIVVGFTVDYAAIVHEDMTKKHGAQFNVEHAAEIAAASGTTRGTAKGGMFLRGDNQQAKFLERPAREERQHILKIIAKEAKI